MQTEEIPTFTGASEEDLEQRLKRLEKENRGLIADLADKRGTIRSLEERFGNLEQSLASAAEDGAEKPEEEVNRLAQDPRGYIDTLVQERITPLEREVFSLRREKKFDEAYRWLGKQEKSDPDDIKGSELETNLAQIVKENGMVSMDPFEGTKAAYKIYQQELKEKQKKEEARDQTISSHSTEVVRRSPPSGPSRFTRAEISAMSIEEFTKNEAAIREAAKKGLIT